MPTTIPGATGTQSVFVSWSQGGAASQTITATTPTTYTATFKTQYYLTTTAAVGGTIDPASGWFDAGSPTFVSATPNAQYYFTGFTGDLTGTTNGQVLSMTAPQIRECRIRHRSHRHHREFARRTPPDHRRRRLHRSLSRSMDTRQQSYPLGRHPIHRHRNSVRLRFLEPGRQRLTEYYRALRAKHLYRHIHAPVLPDHLGQRHSRRKHLARQWLVQLRRRRSRRRHPPARLPVHQLHRRPRGNHNPQNIAMSAPAASPPASSAAHHHADLRPSESPIHGGQSRLPIALPPSVDPGEHSHHQRRDSTHGEQHPIRVLLLESGRLRDPNPHRPLRLHLLHRHLHRAVFRLHLVQSFRRRHSYPNAAGRLVPSGTQVTANVSVNSGWAFNGLSGNLTGPTAPQSLTISAPAAVNPNFIPDFTLTAAAPAPTPLLSSVSFTLTVAPQNGFNDTVTFDAPTLPTGATATFSPASLTGSGTTTVTIFAPGSGGTYAVTLRATAGSGLAHGAGVNLVVQDFSLTPISATAGMSGSTPSTTYQWAVNSINGYGGSVQPGTVYLVDPLTPNDPFSSGSLFYQHLCNLTYNWAWGTDNITLNAVPSPCTAGTYTLLVRVFGSTQSFNHTVNATLNVSSSASFSVTVDPVNPVSPSGALVTYTFSVAKTGNFSGAVGFNILGSPNCGYVVTAPGSQVQAGSSTTLQFNTTGCPTGNTYQFSISGYNLNTNQTVYVSPTLTIGNSAPPDFSLKSSPSTATVTPGAGTVYTLNVAPTNGFTGSVALAVSGLPSGVTATFPAGSTVNSSGTVQLRVNTDSTAAVGSPLIP